MSAGSDFVVPPGWHVVQQRDDGVAAELRGLRVIASVAVESDAHRWFHVSCSRADRLPSWLDVREVKAAWIGDREAYMVFPPAARYVNIHPHVLHLWTRLDSPDGVLPRFDGVLADGSPTI